MRQLALLDVAKRGANRTGRYLKNKLDYLAREADPDAEDPLGGIEGTASSPSRPRQGQISQEQEIRAK
jgi:hypothetical protein